jgi:hypothetical protein
LNLIHSDEIIGGIALCSAKARGKTQRDTQSQAGGNPMKASNAVFTRIDRIEIPPLCPRTACRLFVIERLHGFLTHAPT